ncbi:HepT-like ribonuclease domain-containing protein [Aggregatilineales bacterium SYSU G02658]
MRRDDALILDMIIAAEKIIRFVGALSFEHFEQDDMAQSAVMREIQVLGEAARMVQPQTKQRFTKIAWSSIIGMRNRVVHEYFEVDTAILWQTAQQDIPAIIPHLKQILAELSEAD